MSPNELFHHAIQLKTTTAIQYRFYDEGGRTQAWITSFGMTTIAMGTKLLHLTVCSLMVQY